MKVFLVLCFLALAFFAGRGWHAQTLPDVPVSAITIPRDAIGSTGPISGSAFAVPGAHVLVLTIGSYSLVLEIARD